MEHDLLREWASTRCGAPPARATVASRPVEGSGQGPALLLVHGSTADHTRWALQLPLLEPHATVYAMDRRGRGASGDPPGYAIEDEAADVAAVVDAAAAATGGPVDVLGHSCGPICALEATLLTTGMRRLVLYGSGVGVPTPAGITDLLAALLDQGGLRGEDEKASAGGLSLLA